MKIFKYPYNLLKIKVRKIKRIINRNDQPKYLSGSNKRKIING